MWIKGAASLLVAVTTIGSSPVAGDVPLAQRQSVTPSSPAAVTSGARVPPAQPALPRRTPPSSPVVEQAPPVLTRSGSITPVTPTARKVRWDFDGDDKAEVVFTLNSTLRVDYASGVIDTLVPERGAPVALESGDINGDGYADLVFTEYAVATQEILPTRKSPSRVRYIADGRTWVVPGGPQGLHMDAASPLHQDLPSVPGQRENGDEFGSSLATGDVDHDGFDDVAVGVRADGPLDERLGAVHVFYGSAAGVTLAGNQFLTQDNTGGNVRYVDTFGNWETDFFGQSVALGDVTGDGYADLAIGVPLADEARDGGIFPNEGVLLLLRGSASGVLTSGITRVTPNGLGRPAGTLGFGEVASHVTIADVDGDGRGEVFTDVGVFREDNDQTGGVVVLRGRLTGISATDRQLIFPSNTGATGNDLYYGNHYVARDLTGDGRAELVIGTPITRTDTVGALGVVPATSAGYTPAGTKWYTQNSPGFGDTAENGDYFAFTTSVVDRTGDGIGDLVVSAVNESNGDEDWHRGRVAVYPGGTPFAESEAWTAWELGDYSIGLLIGGGVA